MQKWEQALNKFLERYIHEPWFLGALLCGSYASGNQDEFSDIDVTIVASEDIEYTEKANCYVDGFLMEYVINPISEWQKYMASGLKAHAPVDQYFFAYGKILHDPYGEIAKLRAQSLAELAAPLVPISDYDREFRKYHLWCAYDELKSLQNAGLHIDLQYWLLVDRLIRDYYDFANLQHIPHSKIERILTNPDFAARYHVRQNPPQEFTDKLLSCMNATNTEEKMAALDAFYNYVINVGGGFDIGKFSAYRTREVSK